MQAVEQLTLIELESVIERGLQTYVEVGEALKEISERRLYREQGFDTFEAYCEQRWGFSRKVGYEYMRAAVVAQNVTSTVQSQPSLTQAVELSSLTPDQQRELAARVDFADTTVRELRDIVQSIRQPEAPPVDVTRPSEITRPGEPESNSRLAVHFSSDSPEWYTPKEILARVVLAMGAIDLDPCSNSKESPNVPCANCFTQADDGLRQNWRGRVYMNPPYGREIVPWVEKLVADYRAGNVTEAIALVPARVDTDWFRQFRDYALCFIDGRLKFSGHENSAPFPSAVVYLGGNIDKFFDSFSEIGDVWVRWQK